MKKIFAIVLTLVLLLPVLALAETPALPYGLALGMSTDEVEAAIAADATLSAAAFDKEDYENGSYDYIFTELAIPDTELVASSADIQVDANNSAKESKLSAISLSLMPVENSIATYRSLLASMKATYGEPDSDPFADVESYVEWGTLSATWTTDALRISLSLSRMYEESISIQYSSRINYDAADLAE